MSPYQTYTVVVNIAGTAGGKLQEADTVEQFTDDIDVNEVSVRCGSTNNHFCQSQTSTSWTKYS